MTRINITATETIVYSKEYELAELEEYLGVTLAECEGDLKLFVESIYDKAHGYSLDDPGFAEDLENNGDVQGQVWEGTVTS